jgi:molybdopterin-containing oxidoreductase family iron-sulfur binding subunit
MKSSNVKSVAATLGRALRGKTGRAFWRSLDELSGTTDFKVFLEAEFPSLAPATGDIDRRSLLRIMAAPLALAGLSGGTARADERALPYVNAPEFVVPGMPKWYATAVIFGGYAQPVLGKTHVGRPVKLEGNPDHPATRGATDAYLQAALLGLYDPERSQGPRFMGRPTTWSAFDTAIANRCAEIDSTKGEGFRLLTGASTSPTFERQIAALIKRWPAARWHVTEPLDDSLRLEAAARVFGRPLQQHLRLDQAEVVVSLDDDILGPGPRQAMHGRLWAVRRLARQKSDGDCRLFVAEPTPSLTGTMAEDRLIASSQRVPHLLAALAHAVGATQTAALDLSASEARWVGAATAAIEGQRGRALLSVGAQYAPDLQALGLLVNERIGGLGTALTFTNPVVLATPEGGSLEALTADMMAGRVTTLATIGANPVYAAPAALGFRQAMEKVAFRLHAGLYADETAALSHWHGPLQHELESWSDGRAIDGTVTIVQPLVRPFYAVRSSHVILENLRQRTASDRGIVEATWRATWSEDFDGRWREALVRGFVADSAPGLIIPEVVHHAVTPIYQPALKGLTIDMRPDATIWDGRFANNAWLQETPKPLTKITWGNVILLSPALAAERHIKNGDELQIEANGGKIVGAAWVMPGQERQTITVTLGYGRRGAGRVAEGLGYDAFALGRVAEPWHIGTAILTPTGNRQIVATTQLHQAMDGFDFVRIVDSADPLVKHDDAPSFYPEQKWDSPSWGMSIDLDLCIGCSACVVACVAENNIPVVGKDLIAEGRQMHWLRVDHYHEGDPTEPKTYSQPVPCMHCEQAPCEMGCPVNATVHSSDGLNLQVYNRCIGTRTCSSYCPYKVRRFNWFDYTGDASESIQAMRNPDVTVRSRGVMEKCTYCIQRISAARIKSKIEGREIADGEVVTACQQACPTQAIVFGNVVDPEADVTRRKASPRNYSLLEEANTRPRTTYLARIERTRGNNDGGKGGSE